MLLRRITQHLKEQNWFAVFLDFMIVVVGVFIGIQVANWNQSNLQREDTGLILQQLESDFSNILVATDRAIDRHKRNVSSAYRLITGIRTQKFVEESLHPDLIEVVEFNTPSLPSSTYTEIVASGRLKLIQNEDLADALKQYHEYISLVNNHYGVFIEQLDYAQNVLMRAQTITVEEAAKSDFSAIATELVSVDKKMLIEDPEMHTVLQIAYGVQNNIHVVLVRNRNNIQRILEMIQQERDGLSRDSRNL